MKQMTARQVCELVNGRLAGREDVTVSGVESLEDAGANRISFLGNEKYRAKVMPSAAGIVLVPDGFDQPVPDGRAWIFCDDPSIAFSQVVGFFAPDPITYEPGCHPSAVVHETAMVATSAHIGPNAVVDAGAVIGERTVVGAGSYVGRGATLGNDCLIHPNVTIRERCKLGNQVAIHSGTTIGSDGFGYIPGRDGHLKIPQVGIVQIDDDVEIGANVAVDRARFGRTWIKTGAKIDNLVQIAHNVVIGEYSFIIAQVGISGSTRLGRNVTAAGQVGMAGHLEIGPGATLMAQAGISKDVPAGAVVVGSPAVDRKEFIRGLYAVGRVSKLSAQVRALERELADLKASSAADIPADDDA